MSEQDYERIEQGQDEPDLDTLVYAARITGKSLDFLLMGEAFKRE